VLIAVAASGTTPFTSPAARREEKRRAHDRHRQQCGHALSPKSSSDFARDGSRAIAGSTRMKAGTAQRITLSLLSSLLMIRLGRVYEA